MVLKQKALPINGKTLIQQMYLKVLNYYLWKKMDKVLTFQDQAVSTFEGTEVHKIKKTNHGNFCQRRLNQILFS